jgi:hypothetical protein
MNTVSLWHVCNTYTRGQPNKTNIFFYSVQCILQNDKKLFPLGNLILYIKMNVCLFVWNLYKFTFLNQTLHTSPPWSGRDRRVCMDPKFMTFTTFCALFLWGPLQNRGHKMTAGATFFRDTLTSVISAGVHVTSPTWRRRRRSHPRHLWF